MDTKHIYVALTINIETKHTLVNALFMFTICGSLQAQVSLNINVALILLIFIIEDFKMWQFLLSGSPLSPHSEIFSIHCSTY